MAGADDAAGPVPQPQPSPALALFRHPRGTRTILLGTQPVLYELRRAHRRSIGFVVGDEGLVVSAPRWVGQADIDQALQSKAGWIVRKLQGQAERLERLDAARVRWGEGAQFPYLGQPLRLALDPTLRGAQLDSGPDGGPRVLRLGLPQDAPAPVIREWVQRWLQRQALALFEARCRDYSVRLGVQVGRLRLSAARTRWGSASANGTVRLNWRLIHFDLPTIDYVVAHELAHLREMNHSPAFWALVRAVMPDYETRRRALKDGVVPLVE